METGLFERFEALIKARDAEQELGCRRAPRAAPPRGGAKDEALAQAGFAMQTALDAWPKLTLWGLCDFEFPYGFTRGDDDIYSLSNIEQVLNTLDLHFEGVWSHFRDRASMLAMEHLERFTAARQALRQRERFIRTIEVNRTIPSDEWAGVAEEGCGQLLPHGVFLAAAIAESLIVEPIIEHGRLAGDAWLNLAPPAQRTRALGGRR